MNLDNNSRNREVPLKPSRRCNQIDGRMGIRSTTANEDERTVEIIFSSGARVRRYGFLPDGSGFGSYDEELVIDSESIDLSRLNTGKAPVLNTHNSFDMDDQLGMVVAGSVRIENNIGYCVLKFRDTKDAMSIFHSVIDGTVGNASVGYSVQNFNVEYKHSNSIPLFTATRWTPMEVSMVPIGADVSAGVRSDDNNETTCAITYMENKDMEENVETVENLSRQDNVSIEKNKPEDKKSLNGSGSGLADRTYDTGVMSERKRIMDIKNAVRVLGDEANSFADDLIQRGVSLHDSQSAILEKAASNSDKNEIRGQKVDVGHSFDDPKVMRGFMAEAIASRYTGKIPEGKAQEYRNLTIKDMAKELLEAGGERVGRDSADSIISRALGISDFPLLLQDVGDRILLPSYGVSPSTFRQISRKITNRDFREKKLVRDGDFPSLLPLNEHGELHQGAMGETMEGIKLATVGRRLMLTRQALINDDLGSFADLATKAGQAASVYENETVWGVITRNQKLLSDNKPLFHGDHNNLANLGAEISAESVGKGKTAIRTQKNMDGKTLNYTPSIIVVPAALETVVEQYLSHVVVPTQNENVVPASHKSLKVLVEPLLDANSEEAWYLFCSPESLAAILYAYLEGREGPQMLQKDIGFTGVTFDVVLDFAAAPVESRAVYKNPGA